MKVNSRHNLDIIFKCIAYLKRSSSSCNIIICVQITGSQVGCSLLRNLSRQDFEKARVQYDLESDFNLSQFTKNALKYLLSASFYYLYLLLAERYGQTNCKTSFQQCLNVFDGYSENIALLCLYLFLAHFFCFFLMLYGF